MTFPTMDLAIEVEQFIWSEQLGRVKESEESEESDANN